MNPNEPVQVSVMKKPLPQNVNILTLEPWAGGTILLRLEHLFEVGECNMMSKPVEINLKASKTLQSVFSS